MCSSLVQHETESVALIIPDQRRELRVQLGMCSPGLSSWDGVRTCGALMNFNESPLVMYNSMKGKDVPSSWPEVEKSKQLWRTCCFLIGVNGMDAI